MNIVFLLITLLSLFDGQFPVSVPSDSACISEPFYITEFQEHGFCNAQEPYGNMYMFACKIKKYSDYFGEYEGFKFLHTCIYTPTLSVPPIEIFITVLPLVNNKPFTMSHSP